MKKLLRHIPTGKWLGLEGRLTNDINEAVQVSAVSDALGVCRKYDLTQMEMVWKFDAEEYDVTSPIGFAC